MRKITSCILLVCAIANGLLLIGCERKVDTGWSIDQVKDDPIIEPVRIDEKAPLYWTVYEYCYEAEVGNTSRNMPWSRWQQNIQWVEKNLLPYGYNMVCTDGFMTMYSDNSCPYMTHYGEEHGVKFPLTDIIKLCKEHGLRVGVYDNPLWIHCDDNLVIEGTNIKVGSLRYEQGRDQVLHPEATGNEDIFTWAVPSHKGCKEFIDGFFKYYSKLGVNFIRMDFMCLFETGTGMGGNPGRGYGREEYELALQYIHDAAVKYNVFTSIVMPNCVNHAELERKYMNMMRAEADVFCGHWAAFSGLEDEWIDNYKGATYYRRRGDISENAWPHAYNVFDGFIYWSDLSGRGNVILDGDFTRLTTLNQDGRYNTADECRSVISLQLMGGGPIACADQFDSEDIDNRVQFYQNEEMLALNTDGFVGKPLSQDLSSAESQVWYGKLSTGEWVVGLFNREPTAQTRSFGFATIGESSMKVRDLWEHRDEGAASSVSVKLAPHACKIVKLSK